MNPSPGVDPLAAAVRSSVEEKRNNLPRISFFDSFVCVYGVPDGLRKVNPLSYTPRLVAMGPLHRDNPQLKPMEDLKLRFLREYLTTTSSNIHEVIAFITKVRTVFCSFYDAEKNMPKPEDLCEMMLLDSIFIIQIFLKKKRKDSIFENYWWLRDLMHDFLLIENQIPFFIPHTIYNCHYCQSGGEYNHTNFSDLVASFFQDVMTPSPLPSLPNFGQKIPFSDRFYLLIKPGHFVEYLRTAYFPPVSSQLDNHFPPSQPASLQLDSTQPLLPLAQKKSNKEENWKSGIATASKLLEYGVEFEVGTDTTTSLMGIQFKPKDGILTIPQIKVNDWTETMFRNLIAFEHCQHATPSYVTDYIIFMDSLINTQEDVNILTNKGIIKDDLHDPEKISELFNNLYKEVITENRHFFFAQEFIQLNDYRRDWCHQWKARWYKWELILKRDYFNSPWSIISFAAAVILLGLTLVQAVYSVYQPKGKKI